MDSLRCFGIRNSDKFILHFNQVCFQIYGMAPPYPIYMGKRAKISPKIHKIEIWPKIAPKSDKLKKKWHFEWPDQNSKTTFIVQTFPKYGPYDFYFVNLSLLGAILAIFQFCGYSGLFWPFSLVKQGQTLGQNLPISSWPNFVFKVIGQFYT